MLFDLVYWDREKVLLLLLSSHFLVVDTAVVATVEPADNHLCHYDTIYGMVYTDERRKSRRSG